MTLALLAFYLAAMLAIGLASRRAASAGTEAFYVADRSYGPLRGFVALASTTTGGSSTLVCAALVYRVGLPGIWLDLSGAIGLLALGAFLAPKVRATGAFTLPEIAGRLYGRGARGAAALLVVLAEIAWFALLVEASQTVLTAAIGVPPVAALIASAAVFIAYTAIGGQYAVIRTDLVQYSLMVLGVLGVGVAAALSATHGRFHVPDSFRAFPFNAALGPREAAAWLVLIALPHLVGSDVYAKLLSCRDGRSARIAAFGAAGSKIAFGAGMAAVALALRSAAPPLARPDEALPRALAAFAPGFLGAFALVALLAAMHSSSDSVLLSAAAATGHDLRASVAGRAEGLGPARWLVPMYGILGLAVALAMRDVVATLELGYSFFAAGMILPILFGFFRRLWVPSRDAVAAMALGGAVAVAGRFAPRAFGALDPVLAGTAVNLAVLLLAILRTRLRGRCPGDYGLPGRL